ncbi:MAG: hypothetical protein KDK54_15295 [Leptospiraceae bacterium]|nr:hypothetical protein [Leptospiraceae bacterium]
MNLLIKFLILFSISFLLQCNTKKDDKNKLLAAGALISIANSNAVPSTGLTIKIPPGVPLTTKLSDNRNPQSERFIDFLQTIHVIEKAYAAENAWGFVRQSATWANSNTDAIEAILSPIKKSGILSLPGTYQTEVVGDSGYIFIARVTIGSNSIVTSSAFTGTMVFKNKFEMWRKTDSKKALEMYFDSAEQSAKGILLLYNLNILNPSVFLDDLTCETFVAYINNSPKQTISWSGSQSLYTGSDRGRVVLGKMENNSILCFKSVVRFTSDSFSSFCPGSNSKYYSLAYVQNLNTPNTEATAKLAMADGSINTNGTICPSSLSNYTLNYGLFKSSGFIADQKSSGEITSEYPAYTKVDTLFSELGSIGSGEWDGSIGTAVWDDTQKATIDSINISFKGSLTP